MTLNSLPSDSATNALISKWTVVFSPGGKLQSDE
jgi:hypothetical protein